MSKKLINSYIIMLIIVIVVTSVLGAVLYRPSIHDATYEQILEIDDIGIVLTERITKYLKENPNCDIQDLKEICGIGDYRLKLIRKEFR